MKLIILYFIIIIPAILLFRDIPNIYYSFIGDEYQFFHDAKEYIAQPNKANIFSQTGVYGYHPVADTALQAVGLQIFGTNIYGWKITNIIVLMLSTMLIFSIAEVIWNTTSISLCAAAFFSFSHYLFAFAHIGYNNLHALLPSLAATYFYILGTTRKKAYYCIVSGLFGAACFYTFYSARLIAALLLIFILYRRKHISQFIGGFLLLYTPFVLTNLTILYKGAIQQVSGQTPWQIVQNYVYFLKSLLSPAALPVHHFVVGPLVSPILTVLFFISLTMFRHVPRKIRHVHVFLYTWFLCVSGIAVGTFYQNTIPTTRLHLIVPPLALVCAYTLHKLTKSASITLGIVLLYCIGEIALFYVVTPKKQDLTPEALILIYAKQNPNARICLGPNQFGNVKFVLPLYSVPSVKETSSDLETSLQECDTVFPYAKDSDLWFFTMTSKGLLESKHQYRFNYPPNLNNAIVYYQ